jgi:hypothetical protein
MTLAGWGNIAQMVIGGAAVLALFFASIQIHVTRLIARRSRAYEYADRFNERLDEFIAYQDYWSKHSFAQWLAQSRDARQRALVVPNFIEELATAYNRKLVDREVVAMYLGGAVEVLWHQSDKLVVGMRKAVGNDWLYAEWADMVPDTKRRRERIEHKFGRRRARRQLVRGF